MRIAGQNAPAITGACRLLGQNHTLLKKSMLRIGLTTSSKANPSKKFRPS